LIDPQLSDSHGDVLQVPGYTRRVEREWSYSEKVQQLLSDYMAKYVLLSNSRATAAV